MATSNNVQHWTYVATAAYLFALETASGQDF